MGLGEKLRDAASDGRIEEITSLLDQGAHVDATDGSGETPLMKASARGHVGCVQLLLDRGAQANHQDRWGRTPLIKASAGGHVGCVQLLLDRGAQANLQDKEGQTPLYMASWNGDVGCLQLLLDRGAQVNHQDHEGWTPLMSASAGGQVECVQLLLDRGAQANHQDKEGQTPLMRASDGGHVGCVQLLLDMGLQANHQDKKGQTPLMMASARGHVGCVQLLLDRGAQANHQDTWRRTPLMMASDGGHVGCLQLLLDRGAQANCQDWHENTALHLAAKGTEASCVRTLLSHPGIDINLKNSEGHTAMMVAGYNSLGVFNQMVKTCADFPANSYGKVVLCGHSGSGKSTLTQAIINLSKPMSISTRFVKRVFGRQDVVEPLTAGIIPHQVDSPYSNMVIYDLAGHTHYFSSHSACLEAISHHSPAIFLLLQDLRKDSEAIIRELYYWSAMIDGVCHKCPQKSSVIVVGTHADLLTPEQVTTKLTTLQLMAKTAIRHQNLVKVVALNLTNIYSDEMKQFRGLLNEINKDIVNMYPPIPIHNHLMLAFFKEKLPSDIDAISLSDLVLHIKADSDKVIQPYVPKIIPILKSLSQKGLIVFIPSENPLNSWIVLHKESILKKVNGVIFADPSLKEYTQLASNTGIVPRVVLEKAFPEYNIEMITQFMIHFELCQPVDLSQVDTNMAPESSSSPDLGPLLFFPALVKVDRPSSATVPSGSFGWSMIVKCTNQFFTPRFHHVLLRRLPFEFALPTVQATPLHFHLNRRCDVWSRGVKWQVTGVTTMVEMSEIFQSLSLAMFFPDRRDPKYLELARRVLAVIKKACQEFCPHVEVLDVISCPPEASSDHSDDTKVELSLLKKALLTGDKYIDDVSGQKYVVVGEWLKKEPCLPYLVEVPSGVVPSPSELAGQAVPQLEVSTSTVSSSPLLPELVGQAMPLEDVIGAVQPSLGDNTPTVVTTHTTPAEQQDVVMVDAYDQADQMDLHIHAEGAVGDNEDDSWLDAADHFPQEVQEKAMLKEEKESSSTPIVGKQSMRAGPAVGAPTMPELLSFSAEKLNIAVKVGVEYWKFGIFLLNDTNGDIVTALEMEHRGNAERINVAIFQLWLQRKGIKPVTWSTLIEVLRKIGLCALANKIEGLKKVTLQLYQH